VVLEDLPGHWKSLSDKDVVCGETIWLVKNPCNRVVVKSGEMVVAEVKCESSSERPFFRRVFSHIPAFGKTILNCIEIGTVNEESRMISITTIDQMMRISNRSFSFARE